jgi:hypothetical protein
MYFKSRKQMPIESECRYLKDGEWSRKAFSGSAGGGESAENHAERVAHAAATKDKGCVISTFLFEQNAFPCVKCIDWFLDKSLAGGTFVFACTANEGFYAKECGFVASSDSVLESQEKTIRGVLYASSRRLYARKKRITVKKSGVDYSFTTDRSINITATEAIPEELRDLPALNVEFV